MRTPLLPWLFMCSLLLVTSINSVEVCGQCLGSQKSLLIQFKNSLTFDHSWSTKLVKWNESLDCCSWEGVSYEEGCVTHLDLSYESIYGGLDNSSILFNLQNLKSLDLSSNIFNSSIPSRIGNLTRLSFLNLSNAGFVGQIPIHLSRLRSLVTLDLSNFYQRSYPLKLENPSFSMLVWNLSMLEELYLDKIPISARGNMWCQALSSSTPKLRVLSLPNCSLSGPFNESLGKLQSLSMIRLHNNNLSAPVPRFFANFSNLTLLSLRHSQLKGTFPQEIFQVPTLQTLDLSFNDFLQDPLPEFHDYNALQSLSISFTDFDGSLPNSMTMLTKLVLLDLSYNIFTGQIPSFNMSKNLTRISLSYNRLKGEIPSAHLEGLLHLVTLDLQGNFLSEYVPVSIFSLPLLEHINLFNNQFSSCNVEFQVASCLRVETLDMSGNKLVGLFPKAIFKLRNLTKLVLSYNNLNGTLDLEMFKGMEGLEILDHLSYNNLSINASCNDSTIMASFPSIITLSLASSELTAFPNLRNLSFLRDLDLSDNQLHGKIPNWIWEGRQSINMSRNFLVGMEELSSPPISIIVVLDLHLNRLNGKIPILPPLAQYVDLSDNNFTSYMPINLLDGLSSLYFFSMSNNGLTGNIPESICFASRLEVLDLSGNNLSGRIPTCMPAMTRTLRILNLRRNNLRGLITDAFPADCRLEMLVLSGNFIEGELPKSLVSCSALEVLDLGKNKMIGKFPCLLKKIPALRVIVLRSNCFHGSIGCLDTKATWPMLQIFDLAHNNFSGILPGHWSTKLQSMVVNDDYIQSTVIGFWLPGNLKYNMLKSDTEIYYQDAVTVTSKGHEMEMQKILSAFTYIDLSSNKFNGEIPREVGLLRALYALNLSINAFTGEIPSSIGNLRKLESLDLSRNNLSGLIPPTLASLNFLSFLNLSFNHLVGSIPKGSQIQTFSADSFIGNTELCGFPLIKNCTAEVPAGTSRPKSPVDSRSDYGRTIDWNLLSAEVGFIFGFGLVILPLMFYKRWRVWYFERVDDIVLRVFPSSVSRYWFRWMIR